MVPLLLGLEAGAEAQTRFTYSRGQSISPAFEGWWQNADGTYSLFFGYMNSNWEQQMDVPVGPDNNIEPGGPDRGQPTHFYPRRNMFLFTVEMPADFVDQELIWTLTTNGQTARAYASLRTDYLLDPQTIGTEMGANFGGVIDAWRDNQFPDLDVAVDQPRRVRVGEPLELVAFASDDGIPAGDYMPPEPEESKPHPAYRAPRQIVPGNPPGLRLSWIVYRGDASKVRFSGGPAQDLAGHAGVRQLPLVVPLRAAAGPPGGQVGGGGHVRRAGHLRAARHGERRGADEHREPRRHRHPLSAAPLSGPAARRRAHLAAGLRQWMDDSRD